jgi:hypothetical protein
MKLSTWIDKNGGTTRTGEILGVQRNCVYAWRKGVALPRAIVMKKIKDRTRGAVSYDEMIEEFLAKKGLRAKSKPKAKTGKKRKLNARQKAVSILSGKRPMKGAAKKALGF